LRWIQIRVADIDPALRQTFERHGVGTMQALLASHDRVFEHEGYGIDAKSVRDSLLAWLTEQYDREERKETWHITMEAAIAVFVGIEVFHLLIH
jgi:hypothetical protein